MELKDVIIDILNESRKARNNNTYLVSRVYQALNISTDLFDLADNKNAPAIETILRYRRRIVEEMPQLNADKDVVDKRAEQIEKYIDISKELI